MAERLARCERELPRGATPRAHARRRGDRPDLLVHRRGRGIRPGPAARDPGLVRPPPARLGSGSGRRLERRRVPDRVPGHPRPQPAASLRRHRSKTLSTAVAASNASSGGHVVHKGNAEYVVRGVGRLGASPTPGDESFDSGRAVRDLENVVVPLAKGRHDPARRGR